MSEDSSQSPPVPPVRKGLLTNEGSEAGKQGNSSDPLSSVPKQLVLVRAEQLTEKACALARETAARILVEFGPTMQRRDRIKIFSAFKRKLIPARRPGRRPKESVTAAYRDWKAGMRGVELYRNHIPGWYKHSRWRRRVEQEALRAAIHTRKRRERQRKQRNDASK